jgi:hypothetical protein
MSPVYTPFKERGNRNKIILILRPVIFNEAPCRDLDKTIVNRRGMEFSLRNIEFGIWI